MKSSIFILLILTPFHLFAGNEVGNGGDVIICKENVQLLDYFEAKNFNFTIANFNEQDDYKKIVIKILDAFSATDQKLADQYKLRFTKMDDLIEFKSDVNLADIPDSHHELVPKDCNLKQIAIRRPDEKNPKLFLIDQDLWNKLDHTNKAGLVLHEIIYEHFLYLGEKNSKKARYMNALITHLASDKATLPKTYKTLLQELSIPIYR